MNGFPMTKTERRFLATLHTLTTHAHIPPTLDEMSARMGGSKGHLCYLRDALQERGYVTFLPRTHRSLQLTEAGKQYLAVESEQAS